MEKNRSNEDFYVLEYKEDPGFYLQDSQFMSTPFVLRASRFNLPEEALKYVSADTFNVCKVHIEVKRV